MKTDRDVKVQALKDWFEHYNRGEIIKNPGGRVKHENESRIVAKTRMSIGISLAISGALNLLFADKRNKKAQAIAYLLCGGLCTAMGFKLLTEIDKDA